MTCPCEKHSACVPGCALMDYPGYMVSFESVGSERRAQQQQDIMPRSLREQQEVEEDGFRTAYPEMPYSPPLPDVTRDPAPVAELVQDIDDWYAANDPLMAGAGDGNSPPWTENKLVDRPVLETILEARGERYGAFIDNAVVAQSIKEAAQGGPNYDRLHYDQREAIDQIAAKISRIVTGDPDYVDNWDDIAGYAKLVAERLREEQAA